MAHQPIFAPTHAAAALATDCAAVAAAGVITADAAEVARLRAEDGPAPLRHADELTVLSLAAVRRAAADTPLGPFDDWAVVAAPRWQGRFAAAAVIDKFHAVGVRGVGPQAIPNLCLHAVAATVSIGVAARGPVFGAGGGPAHVADGLLAALAVQLARRTAGTWLALADWDGDLATGTGRAVALALVPAGSGGARWSLTRRADYDPGLAAPARLAGLADFLTPGGAVRWDCPLDGGGELALAAEGEP